MPSKQKRHTCIICGAKRVVSKMKSSYNRYYKGYGWHCDLEFIPFGSNKNLYCSKRTPQEENNNIN